MTGDGLNLDVVRFAGDYPQVSLHVNATSRHVDWRRDGTTCIARGMALEPGLIARTLAQVPVLGVAGSELSRALEVRRAACAICASTAAFLASRGASCPRRMATRERSVTARRGHVRVDEINLLCEAALSGFGIAFFAVAYGGELGVGKLVKVPCAGKYSK